MRIPVLTALLGLLLTMGPGCETSFFQPVDAWTGPTSVSGTVTYLVRLTTTEGRTGEEWRPVRGVRVEILRESDGDIIAVGETDANGRFDISLGDDPPANVRARVIAKAQGARINLYVVGSDVSEPPWSAVSAPGDGRSELDVAIEDRFTAGAFHIVQLMHLVADALSAVAPDEVPEKLRVRWAAELEPLCGSCFFEDTFQLDIGGGPNEEDAWDDSVMLHEFGHYVEAAFGTYANPGGLHNLEYVSPRLAWSEGFATWFASMLRDDPIYVDVQPGGIYVLDMESPPASTKGTADGTVEGKYSEGLVYGLLWDLSDDPSPDDEDAAFSVDDSLSTALGLLKRGTDLGAPSADLTDWLNDWRCIHPGDDSLLQQLLLAVEYPYDTAAAPVSCP